MLKFSTKARYALRAMLELTLREGNGPVHLREIARAQQISQKYLEQLTIPLRNAGLVRTERGPNGGYTLARPSRAITAYDVVLTVEGSLDLLDCISNSSQCERADLCVTRDLWITVSEAVKRVLAETTLAELAERQKLANVGRVSSYQI